MGYLKNASILILSTLLFACNAEQVDEQETGTPPAEISHKPIEPITQVIDSATGGENRNPYEAVPDTGFVAMNEYASGFAYEMKYASSDNFLQKKVYACDKCLLRKEVAEALKEANEELNSRGFRIKFYDCYRPLSVQKQMWEIYPVPGYVANPYTSGSIHNRGGAVDITLVDAKGQELDMGTGFDHFGKEAHHSYGELPDTVLANRRLLKQTMEGHGFQSIRTEWWHYNFRSARGYPLSDFTVECD